MRALSTSDNNTILHIIYFAYFQVKRGEKSIEINLTQPVPICGDIKVEFFHRSNKLKKVSEIRQY